MLYKCDIYILVTEKGWECSSDDETAKPTTAPFPCMDQNEKNERVVQPKIDNPVSLTAPPTIQQTVSRNYGHSFFINLSLSKENYSVILHKIF